MKERWKWLVPGALALAGLALAGLGLWWSTACSPRDRALARIQRAGSIRIGYAVEAPYVFLDSHGKLTGEEVELARVVAARLSLRIEWLQTEFRSLIPELEAGQFDAVVAGMFITPERARRVSFSEPTFRVRQALLVQAGNPHRLHAYEDVIEHPRLKLAVMAGAVEEELVRRLGVPADQLIVVPDALTGRVAVESSLAGGLALSSPTVRFMARQRGLGLTEIAEPFEPPGSPGGPLTGFGAVAFRARDDDLQQAWNRELIGFLGSAGHRRLLARFGFGDDELSLGVTTAEILSPGAR